MNRRLLDDPYARCFISNLPLRLALMNPSSARTFLRVVDRVCGPGFHTFIVLRARYADDACDAAIRDGVDQLVLLGAGLDTTSLRRVGIPMTIFEVDMPATQQHKRAISEKMQSAQNPNQIVWVPCDFEKDTLSERLLTAGFDPKRPSLIVWTGVSLYLTGEAIVETLDGMSTLCAPGSRVVFDYIDADVITGHSRSAGARRIARRVARRGEPFRSGFTEPELDALFATHGFSCQEHLRTRALQHRYATNGSMASTDTMASTEEWQTMTIAERT